MPLVESESAPVMNSPMRVPMTEKRRELMLRAMDGVNDLAGTMYILHHYKFADEILTWLICHRWTGNGLAERIVKQFRSSVPALVDYVVAVANGEVPSNVREVEP